MPELPEVETIRLGLEKYLVGLKIESVDIRFSKIFQGDPQKTIGATFKGVRRFGKVLSLDLSNGFSIVVHVKMTGQLIFRESKVSRVPKVSRVGDLPYDVFLYKHTHVIFHFKGESKLFYNDIRKFGWIKIVDSSKLMDERFIKSLGIDALKMTQGDIAKLLHNKTTKIKILLMDQTKIAGVGNIYANEALFLAGINPTRKAMTLTQEESRRLLVGLGEVLRLGLKYGGSSENTYVNALGEKGSYQEHSLVYGKLGKLCSKCGTKIKRFTLGGRGTFFCEKCQT